MKIQAFLINGSKNDKYTYGWTTENDKINMRGIVIALEDNELSFQYVFIPFKELNKIKGFLK